MLVAEKCSVWRNSYDIGEDGRQLARWEPWWFRSGGSFDLDGQRYEVRGHAIGSRFELVGPSGEELARAHQVGRRHWTVDVAGGPTYRFRRASLWRLDQELVLDDRAVGSVRRAGTWRSSAVADLPGLSLPVQVFVVCVVLAMWAAAAAASA